MLGMLTLRLCLLSKPVSPGWKSFRRTCGDFASTLFPATIGMCLRYVKPSAKAN